jgi:CheY-like chemotaxis protein
LAESPRRVIGLAPGQGQIRVLVVDDEPTNRDLLREMLKSLGFVVEEADGGQEAITKAAAHRPRVILMDLIMPGMDGAEATRILRQTCPAEATAIIGVSASTFEESKQRFLDSGICAFISKPFREQELFDALARHAKVMFETEALPAAAPNPPVETETPTLGKMSGPWRKAFAEALAMGSITRLRDLGEEARAADPDLAAYVLERAARYDMNGLKKLSDAANQKVSALI